ncbi:methyltransferase domain-containing protein [bacterium]|nr:methyltransferase domain-containing protein [bacterium]
MFSKFKIERVDSQTGFDLLAQTYDTTLNPVRDLSNEIVKNWMTDLYGKRLLDLGCGTGYFCEIAEKKGAQTVIGIDHSEKMISIAQKKLKTTQLICQNLETTQWPDLKFDLIVSALVVGYISNLKDFFSKIARVLEKKGVFLITDFHPFQILTGAERSFLTQSKNRIEIHHFLHMIEDYISACNTNNFYIADMKELLWQQQPLVLALQLKKL